MATRVWLITSWCWIDGSVCRFEYVRLALVQGKMDGHNPGMPVKSPSMTLERKHQNK